MKKGTLSVWLCVLMVVTLAPAATAYGGVVETYEGDNILIAVNTNTGWESDTSGSFASDLSGSAERLQRGESELDEGETAGVFDCYVDEATGRDMTVLEPNLPKLEPIETKEHPTTDPKPLLSRVPASYAVNSTFQLKESGVSTRHAMKCIAVGSHCTVWSATGDDVKIQISTEQAEAIVTEFEQGYENMLEAFGTPYDADGDGRVAIMCYDIEADYPNSTSTYTGGYFYMADMIDGEGKINGVNYGTQSYSNGIDCIHIDTFPQMGSIGEELTNMEQSYSTLFHELQHMINFSYQVDDGGDGYYEDSQTYMNEAFSMAAEQIVCGPSPLSGRIDLFNQPSTAGKSLTVWNNNLYSYATSYVFGQYLRTQYGRSHGNEGKGFFKALLEQKGYESGTETEKSTLSIAANLLGVTEEDLLINFWKACYLKNSSGVFGFNGESWANDIAPAVQKSMTSAAMGGICNGGAKYYDLTATGSVTVNTANNLTFATVAKKQGGVQEVSVYVSGVAPVRTAVNQVDLHFYISGPGKLRLKMSETPISDKSGFTLCELEEGGSFSISLGASFFGGDATSDPTTLYYYVEDVNGNESEISSVPIRAFSEDKSCYATLTKTEEHGITFDYYGKDVLAESVWLATYDVFNRLVGIEIIEIDQAYITEVTLPSRTASYGIFMTGDSTYAPLIEAFSGRIAA